MLALLARTPSAPCALRGDARRGRRGLARELARINLPLATYTQWYWKIDLHNLFHFLGLRADPHAQYEIRVYAEAMLETVRRWAPLAHAAFVKNRLGAVTLSAPALAVVRRMLAGEQILAGRERPLRPRVARADERVAPPGMTGSDPRR